MSTSEAVSNPKTVRRFPQWPRPKRTSGVGALPEIPRNSDSTTTFSLYLSHWQREISHARSVVKARARSVAVLAAAGSGVVAIFGAIAAAFATAPVPIVFGLLSTAVSSAVAVLVVWDQHFHHRELWIQRTQILNDLQRLRMRFEFEKPDDDGVAEFMGALQSILVRDQETWAAIQGSGQPRMGELRAPGLSAEPSR